MANDSNTCREHRAALMRRLPDGLILLAGGREVPRNFDVNYVFRQHSDFLYLAGVEDPGCHLLMDPKRRTSTLLIPRIDNNHRVWDGHVPGIQESKKLFGFSSVAYAEDLPKLLKKHLRGYRNLYADKIAWKAFKDSLRKLKVGSAKLQDALEELRAVKTPGELALMARANQVSGRAHRMVMAATRAGMHEYQVQASFEAECLKAGLKHLAYPSIVAAGANSAVLHYRRNTDRLKDGDLLLIDAGAEAKGYAADITRTFPISRRFTQRQKDIYSIVLETQKTVIARARPGVNWADLHMASLAKIADGLKSLGLLRGDVSGLVQGGAIRLFYPHGIGHMLGLNVHDGTGGRKRQLPNPKKIPIRFVAKLEPGFAVTVEPGIYFISALLLDPELRRKHKGSIDFSKTERFLDFGGVRIEDDIVISRSGPPRNLTDVPKEIAQIEELRRAD